MRNLSLALAALAGFGPVVVILFFFGPLRKPLSEFPLSDALMGLLLVFAPGLIGAGVAALTTALWSLVRKRTRVGGHAVALGLIVGVTGGCYAEMAVILRMGDPGIGGAFIVMWSGLLVGGLAFVIFVIICRFVRSALGATGRK